MSDPYENVQTGGLKLKGVKDGSVKKKKKKEKEKLKQSLEHVSNSEPELASNSRKDERTATERAFDEAQERMKGKDIVAKASKSHKERVSEFNKYLEDLSEHYDIQKVSWTK